MIFVLFKVFLLQRGILRNRTIRVRDQHLSNFFQGFEHKTDGMDFDRRLVLVEPSGLRHSRWTVNTVYLQQNAACRFRETPRNLLATATIP